MTAPFKILGLLSLIAVAGSLSCSSSKGGEYTVSAYFSNNPESSDTKDLLVKKWTLPELKAMKQVTTHEKNPLTGGVAKWVGVPLASLIEEAFKEIPAEKRAQVDLIILKNDEGKQALVPLFFSNRYPILIALHKDRMGLPPNMGPVYSVVPWTSKPKVLGESVPLESYFLSKISKIELTNYQVRYGHLFLKRMTDPAAVRGQKLFVQSCVTCHATGRGPTVEVVAGLTEDQQRKMLESGTHPGNQSGIKLSPKDLRALMSYLKAYQQEKLVSQHGSALQFLPKSLGGS
ncbi:c-type cytochrome [bacterium]|nr:c-type cytochrome [bacterium]